MLFNNFLNPGATASPLHSVNDKSFVSGAFYVMSESKFCNTCKCQKPLSEFYFAKRTRSGRIEYDSLCIKCKKEYFRLRKLKKYDLSYKVPLLEGEIWKDVILDGFNGLYMVSNMQRVKSLPNRQRPIEALLTKSISTVGRYMLCFTNSGYSRSVLLSRLVATAFIPNPKNLPVVGHIDNNPLNNAIDNLEWCTHKENSEHAVKCGRMQKGSKRHNSVFTEKQVLEIFNSNLKTRELAEIYNVSKSAIGLIKLGINWSHLTGKIHIKRKK